MRKDKKNEWTAVGGQKERKSEWERGEGEGNIEEEEEEEEEGKREERKGRQEECCGEFKLHSTRRRERARKRVAGRGGGRSRRE